MLRCKHAVVLLLLAVCVAVVLAVSGGTDARRDIAMALLGFAVALMVGTLVLAPAGQDGRLETRSAWPGIRTLGLAALVILLLGGLVIYLKQLGLGRWTLAQMASVGGFAGAVGFGELVSRYRDDPGRLLGARPTAVYVSVNIAAGILALALVKEFGVFAGTEDKPVSNQAVKEVLLASFGAIAFFRSSLFTARIGGTDIGIGPSTLLKALLDSSDRLVNRDQAENRADRVERCMEGIDFDKAKATLPVLCLSLVEGLSEDEQKQLGEQIAKLDQDSGIAPDARSAILGVYLLRQVGGTVLERAVRMLGPRIRLGE